MSKGDKYIELKHYLIASKIPVIKLSYNQIEEIISNTLPASATRHPTVWWSNNYSHAQAVAWLDAGYETECVSDTYENNEIVFIKVHH